MVDDRSIQYSNKELRDDVVHIAWPVLTEVLLGTLFGMIDMMMLGRISNTAVAAASVATVGMTNQPLFVGLSFIQALNIGGTALIARYYGAGEHHKINHVMKHVLLLALFCFAIPLSILGIIFSGDILRFMGAEPYTVTLGQPYFRIIMVGFIFQSITFAISAALRGIGETKIPMRYNIIANTLNVGLNAILIYGLLGFPALGIVGASVATALSNIVAMCLMVRYLFSGKSILHLKRHDKFTFQRTTMKNLIRIGFPSAGEQLILRAGMITFLKIVAGLGTSVFAAQQIAMNIVSLSFTPGQALGIAASSLVGRSLGARLPHKAKLYARTTSYYGAFFACLMGLIFFFGGQFIAQFYSKDPQIIQNTATALMIIALVQPFQNNQLILAGALRGAGDTVWPLVSSLVSMMGIRLIFAYFFVNILGWGLAGAWYAVFIDQFIRWLIIALRFRSNHWQKVQL